MSDVERACELFKLLLACGFLAFSIYALRKAVNEYKEVEDLDGK